MEFMWLMATYLDSTEISSRNQTVQPSQPPPKGITKPRETTISSTDNSSYLQYRHSLFARSGWC